MLKWPLLLEVYFMSQETTILMQRHIHICVHPNTVNELIYKIIHNYPDFKIKFLIHAD